MNALNLYTLTRIRESTEFSKLEQALSGRGWRKHFSAHEVFSLCALTDRLTEQFCAAGTDPAGLNDSSDWVSFFDGFYFSYTIEHISKEFDLLKLAPEGGCVLNIELKSESIEEERIQRQLEQNRYYLSHIARVILSYSYVMANDTLYCLNDRGFLKKCDISELSEVLKRPGLQHCVDGEIRDYFRARDYLISPVKTPEKFLAGRYFLTNQQSEFRRQILDVLESRADQVFVPVLSLIGSAGTGKTLLLFDLAMEISRKHRVLLLHGGPLREGHRLIDTRLRKVDILSGTDPSTVDYLCGADHLDKYAVILVDEANRFSSPVLKILLDLALEHTVPCIFAYDPHSILGAIPPMEDAETIIGERETLRLELSGNIRINRPVFSFLRTLFNKKDRPGFVDYSCIDVLYAKDRREQSALTALYLSRGYELITASYESYRTGEIISQEYDRVLMVLDSRFYYDDNQRLCADDEKEAAIPPLYEGLSRTKEKLCLIVVGNKNLFSEVLAIRMREMD